MKIQQKMKRISKIVIALLLVFSFASCVVYAPPPHHCYRCHPHYYRAW